MPTALVTGANRGIGLALCAALAERGSSVHAVCRHGSAELAALPVTVHEGIDVSDAASLARLRAALGGVALDLAIMNAGVLSHERLGALDADAAQAIRRQFEINALAPLLLTESLLANLMPGARLALITSRMGSIGDNSSGGYYGYRMSKAALNAAGRSLALDMGSRGVAVAILHPGYVATGMTGHRGDTTPAQVAQQLLARIDALTPENSGTFWHANGSVLPW